MKIYGREIGLEHQPYFVAEIGANHDGSLTRAFRLIELAADAGADAVKFQHFAAETIVSRRGFEELGKLAHQAAWEEDVFKVYGKASVPLDWTPHLASYAHDHGIAFLTTPYSLELVDAVEPYVDAYKIGSGDITYSELARRVADKNVPVLAATGASTQNDVDHLMGLLTSQARAGVVLMQCNTDYTGTVGLGFANLDVLRTWRDRYVGPVVLGISDHTLGDEVACAAVTLGARVIEKHFTDDRQRKGPDHGFATEPHEWVEMQTNAMMAYVTVGDGEKRVEANEREAAIVQRRALRYARSLAKGHVLVPEDLVPLRPCPPGAWAPYRAKEASGRKLKRHVAMEACVQDADLVEEKRET